MEDIDARPDPGPGPDAPGGAAGGEGTPPARAGRREWAGLAVLALPALLVALDIGVLFLALPHLSADLGASTTQQLWITDVYGFLLAGFLIPMGTLGDRIGRRKLLLFGAAAFGAASVLAAFSRTPEMLIAARALLGIAGATLGPSTLSLISAMFADPRQRGVAISIWGTCQFGGAALGPVIGGLLLQHFWWGSAFLLGVPVMVALLVVGPILLPEYRASAPGRFDVASVGLALAAILPAVWGVKELAVGARPVAAVLAFAIGLGAGVVFLRRQARLDDPLVDLALLRDRSVGTVLAGMALGGAALAGAGLMTSQYVQTVGGLAPAAAGLWQAPTGLGIAAGVLLSPLLARRLSPVRAIVVGLTAASAGLVALTQVEAVPLVALFVAVAAFGLGPLFALGTGLVVGSAPVAKAGSAASLSETSNLLGSTLGLAVLGSVGAAVYRARLDDGVSETARQNVAAAADEATRLPAGPAADLLDTAFRAFTDGLAVVAGTAAVFMLAVAVLVARRLRTA